MTELWAFAGAFTASFLGALGSLFFKKGSRSLSAKPAEFVGNTNLMAGFALYGISAMIFVIALRGGELSVLYPIAASSYIWVSLMSVKFLGEKMDRNKWAGIALIIAGVSLIGFGAV